MASPDSRYVEIYRRTDFVGQLKEDNSVIGCSFVGRTELHDAADTSPVWQIKRITYVDGVLCTEYADYGKYNQIWADRTLLFPACPPGAEPIPGQTETNVVTAPPDIEWLEMTLADTEYSYTLPDNTKRFEVLNNGIQTVKLAYEAGKSVEQVPVTDNEYWPLSPATTYGENELAGPITIYVQSPLAGSIVVIKSWQQ